MEDSKFNLFYHQLKQVSLTEKKLFLLQREKFLCFTPEQFIAIVDCFPHSNDKTAAVKVLEKRIGGKFKWLAVSRLIKSAVYSQDRIEILKLLIKHMETMSDFEGQRFVASTFDLKSERIKAYHIFNQSNGYSEENEENTDFDAIYDYEEPNFSVLHDYIEAYAKNIDRNSVFDLPWLSDLKLLRNYVIIPENKENIQTEVAKRKNSNRNCFIPSKVSSISFHLKPGRINAIADQDSDSVKTRRKAKSLSDLLIKSPDDEVQQFDEQNGDAETNYSTENVNIEKANEKSMEDSKFRILPINRDFPRFCSKTALEKSKIPLFPPRFTRRTVLANQFTTGRVYSRNKSSVR